MSYEECWIGGKAPEIQRSSCPPRWYCKRPFSVLRSIPLNKDLQHLKWQPPRSWISSPDCQVAWTSSRHSISLYPSKNGRCSQIFHNSQNRNVQTFGFVCHDTSGLNHGPVWKTESFLLSGICKVILWQDCYGKGNLRNPIETWLGENSKLGMSQLCIVKKNYSYLCMWMT